MSPSSLPPRPSLATLLRAPDGAPGDAPTADAAAHTVDAPSADAEHATPVVGETGQAHAQRYTDVAVAATPEPAPAFTHPAAAPAARPTPSFARRRDTPVGRWHWLALAALIALLALQITLADRARLAGQASTRPVVEALCAVFRCSLPAWHEPAAFAMLSRDIRPVPGVAGALQVNASFRNDARWAQAWPTLHLTLSDADGRTIGDGQFQPHHYLANPSEAQQRLAPGQSAQVSFRVREPAAATVAFSFDFQ